MNNKKPRCIGEHSTDSVTPPMKTPNQMDVQIEIEYFDVMYTKHLTQK